MNDPHVVALHYRIEHGPDVVDWSRAAPLDKEEHRFCVSKKVLRRIGELSTNKGGASARKATGHAVPHTPEEERFLKSAIKTMIHRAAEVEFGPDPHRRKITLADI